jgi:type III pantothenate kinase
VGGAITAVIATGGLAPVVIAESRTVTVHRPDLTLQGLRLVYDKNV